MIKDFLTIFYKESTKRIESIISALLVGQSSMSEQAMDEIKFQLHTLKANAGFVGRIEMVDLVHKMESQLDLIIDANSMSDDEFNYLFDLACCFIELLDFFETTPEISTDQLEFLPMIERVIEESGKNTVVSIHSDDLVLTEYYFPMVRDLLFHLVINAIDHGIESEMERTARGKDPQGTIKLYSKIQNGNFILIVEDNGRGVVLDDLRANLVAKDIVTQYEVQTFSESQLLDYLYVSGFTTRKDVTYLSGRGLGLSIVHSILTQLSGAIYLENKEGFGLTVRCYIPL